MAPSILWNLLVYSLVLNLLSFPTASTGITLSSNRPTGLRARYTRSLWSPSYDTPTTSWSASSGQLFTFKGSSPFANGTQLLSGVSASETHGGTTLGAQLYSSLTTALSFSFDDPAVTAAPWTTFLTPLTRGSIPRNDSLATGYPFTPNTPAVIPGPLTPSYAPTNFSITTDFPSTSSALAVTPGPLSTGFSSTSSFDYATSDASSSSGLRSVETRSSAAVNGSTIVTALPPQTTPDGSQSGSSFLGSVASSSASDSGSAASGSSTYSPSSTNNSASSIASATKLPIPQTPTPSPTASISASDLSVSSGSSQAETSSAADMQSGGQSLSSSTSSTTVSPILITPIPIVMSGNEKSSTKDPKKTKGSHSDLVSENEHGNKFTIHIPELPGGCWFCPPGPPGFRLPELTLPGVYPPMKPPGPGWMSIPPLTIDGDGNPTFEPEPSDNPNAPTPASTSASITNASGSSSPSSGSVTSSWGSASQTGTISNSASRSLITSFSSSISSCITTTTQICSTLTSYAVDSSGSTTATRTASSCSPTIGCRVLASDTANVTTSSASSGCWEYDFTLDNQAFENEDEQTFPQVDTAGEAQGLDHIGSCAFSRKIWNPTDKLTMTLPVFIQIPTWPAASNFANVSYATDWYAATMASKTAGVCPTLTYTRFNSAESLTASPLMTGIGGVHATYSLDSDKPSVSVDHAYEIPLITEFLEFIMASQSEATAYCDSFNDFFIGSDPADDNEPRLQTLFYDVVEMYTPELAMIDSVLNDVKEKLLVNLDGLRGGKDGTKQVGSTHVTMSDSEKLQVLNEIGAALALINDEGITSRFNKTNTAIWASFMAIDDLGRNPGCNAAPLPAPTSGSLGWADTYTSYINSKLDQQNTAISNHIQSIIATQDGWFTETADRDGNLNLAGRGLEAFKTGYPESMWTMSMDAMLNWQAQPTYDPLGTATCYSTPTSPDISKLSSAMEFSESAALSSDFFTDTYSEGSSLGTCTEGATTESCWYYPANTMSYNTSWSDVTFWYSSALSTFTILTASGGSWSGNPMTPSPSPTRGSPTAPLTFTHSYPAIITRSFDASRSVQSTAWATHSAANSTFGDGSASWMGKSDVSSIGDSTLATLFSTSSAQSGDSSSTDDGTSSSGDAYSTSGDRKPWPDSGASTSAYPTSWNAHTTPIMSPNGRVISDTASSFARNSTTYTSDSASSTAKSGSSRTSSKSAVAASTGSSTSIKLTSTAAAPSPATTTSAARPSCIAAEQGSPATNFDMDSANQAIDWVCSQWVDSKSTKDNFTKQWGAPYENPISFNIVFEGDGSPSLDNHYHDTVPCSVLGTTLDDSDDAYIQRCKDNLGDILNSCDTSEEEFWWKSGGSAFSYCWEYSIARGTFEDLPDGLVHNNAEYADSVIPDSIHYRPDNTCDVYGDCPRCPVDGAQRKCEGSGTDINYCLCKNPNQASGSQPTALPDMSTNTPTQLTCGTGKQGNPKEFFDLDTATKAIDYACSAWYDAKGDGAKGYYAVGWGSQLENPLHLHISQTDTGGKCPDLYSKDARDAAIAICRDNFEYILNNCDTASNDFFWWKSGGTLIKDCYSWDIRRDEFITKLEPPYYRNNAVDPDELESDDYRPDSPCSTRWQDCPNCPGNTLQRKCISDENRPESGACLCFDPHYHSDVDVASVNAPFISRNTSVFSNTTDFNSLHLRSELLNNVSVINSALEVQTASDSLQCVDAPQGSPRLNFELNGANAAIDYACRKWADSWILKFVTSEFDWSAPYEDPIHLEMLYVGDRRSHSRIRRDEPFCSIKFGTNDDFAKLCTDNMQYILNTCNTASNAQYWWKSGGTYTNDCWRWSLTRGAFGKLPANYMHNDAMGADDCTGVPEYLDYRPDSTCNKWQSCPKCPLPGSQRKCRGDESGGPGYCLCRA